MAHELREYTSSKNEVAIFRSVTSGGTVLCYLCLFENITAAKMGGAMFDTEAS